MKLDRYSGQPPKFRVFRRSDGQEIRNKEFSEKPTLQGKNKFFQTSGVSYVEVRPFDYFVLALRDKHTAKALQGYADGARESGQTELADHVERLIGEVQSRTDIKLPD